jgi:Formate/nitrite transporter
MASFAAFTTKARPVAFVQATPCAPLAARPVQWPPHGRCSRRTPVLKRSSPHTWAVPASAALAHPGRPTSTTTTTTTTAPPVPVRDRAAPALLPTDPPAVAVPLQTPVAALRAAEALGAAKAAAPPAKVLLLAVVAGAYIALGALLALCVGGAVPQMAAANPGLQRILFGLFGLPFGLTLVLTAGG